MSSKSWDIERSGVRKPAASAPPRVARPSRSVDGMTRAPARGDVVPSYRPSRVQTTRTGAGRPDTAPVPTTPKTSKPAGPSLKKRRTKARRIWMVLFLIFILALSAGSFYLIWLPALRVSSVEAAGPGADDAPQLAESVLRGTYFYIIPRNSIFFISQPAIRRAILSAHPEINAVSILSSSLHTLRVTTIARVPAFVWCGSSMASSTEPAEVCYQADAAGLIFAPSDGTASTTLMRVYAEAEEGKVASHAYPLEAHIRNASVLPGVLHFTRTLASYGAGIRIIVLKSDEADLYTSEGVRISYVLGREDAAATLAATTFPTINFTDGSVEYVDLRFSGKVYFKKKPN